MLAVILAAALTRAELIDRLKTPPMTSASGLVRVYANCPEDMRSEFHRPVTKFVTKTCEALSLSTGLRFPRFAEPGIIVSIGSVRTNDTRVLERVYKRGDGTSYTQIYLPAPGFSDIQKFKLAIARAFALAVEKKAISIDEAVRLLRGINKSERISYNYAEIDRWLKGEKTELDDEGMMKLCRTVIEPGVARQSDVLRFASRLYLYPPYYAFPFAGKSHRCTFAQAIELMDIDPFVRFVALDKASQVIAYGGGRSEYLGDAAKAYSDFLLEIARAKKSKEELAAMLDKADLKLNIALEEARKFEEGAKR
ncbi:MAG: hypothetical protein J6S30_03540 [Kiritimatiellae bacterium]|nr:hypothetical protein [Kiritimatiellia bacterium]